MTGRGLWIARAAAAAGSLVLTLAVAELASRLWLGDEYSPGPTFEYPVEACGMPDPDLGWRNKPLVQTHVRNEKLGLSYEIRINSKGLRDREHTYERTQGTFRILLLGDSMAWGWGVGVEETYADLLERELGVEVINAGVPGWSTDQELWWFESEGIRYQPDLVLLVLVMNDLNGNEKTSMYGYEKPRWVRSSNGEWGVENLPALNETARFEMRRTSWWRWLSSRSAIVQALQRRDYAELRRETRRNARSSPNHSRSRDVDGKTRSDIEPGGVTHLLLGRLHAKCAEIGATLVAFTLPHYHDAGLLVPERRREIPSTPRPFSTDLSLALAAAGGTLGFRTLSLDQALLDAVGKGLRLALPQDPHPGVEGHRVIADELARQLAPLVGDLSDRSNSRAAR
jgi:lysophospholipase L1-like esterase